MDDFVAAKCVHSDLILTGSEDDSITISLEEKDVSQRRRVLVLDIDPVLRCLDHQISFVVHDCAEEDHFWCSHESSDNVAGYW